VAANLAEMTGRIRLHTQLPIAVGFGVSDADQAREVAGCADAVVVGSAVVNRIAAGGSSAGMVDEVSAWVRELAGAIRK